MMMDSTAMSVRPRVVQLGGRGEERRERGERERETYLEGRKIDRLRLQQDNKSFHSPYL